jgi:hypothetical protein
MIIFNIGENTIVVSQIIGDRDEFSDALQEFTVQYYRAKAQKEKIKPINITWTNHKDITVKLQELNDDHLNNIIAWLFDHKFPRAKVIMQLERQRRFAALYQNTDNYDRQIKIAALEYHKHPEISSLKVTT